MNEYSESFSKAVKNHVPITSMISVYVSYRIISARVLPQKINATQPLSTYSFSLPKSRVFPTRLSFGIYKLIETLRIGILSLKFLDIWQIFLQIVMKINKRSFIWGRYCACRSK